ncbi:MAG: tetratricopeptide repeat protein [Rikenellaceae bacterium]
MKRFLVVVFLVGLLSVGKSSAQQHLVDRDSLFYSTVEAMLLGSVDDTETMLKLNQIVQEDSTYAPAYYYLSKIAMQERDLSAARSYIDRALSLDSLSFDYREALFYIASSQNDITTTIECLKSFIEEYPNEPYYVIILAQIYGDLGNRNQALALCSLYEERYGLNFDIVDLMRRLYLVSEDYFLALGLMMRAVGSDPDNITYRLLYAEIAVGVGENATAENQYRQVVKRDPSNLDALLGLAGLYQRARMVPQFIATLQPIFSNPNFPLESKIKIFEESFFTPDIYQGNYYTISALMTTLRFVDSSNEELQLLNGRFLSYTGDLEGSAEIYEQMLAQNPKEPNKVALERLIDINLFQEMPQEALHYAKIGKKHYDDQSFVLSEIIAHSNSGDISKACRLIDKAARTAKSDSIASELYGMKGDLLHSSGNETNAFKAYEVALKYNPYNTLVLNNYGYFLALTGQRLQDALAMTSRANKLELDNPTYLDSQAWVLFLMGRLTEAQTIMRRVIALDNDPSGDVLMHYGDILYALGDDFMSKSYWKRALKAGADTQEIEERLLRPKAQAPLEE